MDASFMLALAAVLIFVGGFSTCGLLFYTLWGRKHLQIREDDKLVCPLCNRNGLCANERHFTLASDNADLERMLHHTNIHLRALQTCMHEAELQREEERLRDLRAQLATTPSSADDTLDAPVSVPAPAPAPAPAPEEP